MHTLFYCAVLCYSSICYGPVTVSVGLPVCLYVSVTSQSSTITAKLMITQTTPYDSQVASVLMPPKVSAKFDRVTPNETPGAGGVC